MEIIRNRILLVGIIVIVALTISTVSAQTKLSVGDLISALGSMTRIVGTTNDAMERTPPKVRDEAEKERLMWYSINLKELLWKVGKLRIPNSRVRDALRDYLDEPTPDKWRSARMLFNETLKLVIEMKERLKSFDDPVLNQIVTGINLREEILNALVAMPLPTTPEELKQLGDLYIAYDRLAQELMRQNDLLSKCLKIGLIDYPGRPSNRQF
jgi:hypothetical protein